MSRALRGLTAGLLGVVLLGGCPQNPAGNTSGISVRDPVESHLAALTVNNGDGTSYIHRVPDNQIMVMFGTDVAQADAEATLARMEREHAAVRLEIVGRIPDLGIYQLEIENNLSDSGAALAALDTVMAQLTAYPGVVTVGYNEILTGRAIENDDDNCGCLHADRCALAVIDYYQAIPLFDEALRGVTLSDVAVAVVDSGLWVESDQFDDILPRTQFIDLPASITSYDFHLHKHGTNIAALLAADNGDGLVNGIALRVLGEHLRLIVGEAHIWGNDYSMARAIARTRQAVLAGADIVILSFGSNAAGRSPQWLASAQAQFGRLFTQSPGVLFIAAASNDRLVLNGNDVPSGLPNANLLTVGGLESCALGQRYTDSATGPGIEIAAPATGVPGFVGDNMVGPAAYALDGNSFAAPLVAAIAAIVKSINPDLSGASLKAVLLDPDHIWPAPAEVGGKRPALIKTVSTVLLDRGVGGGAVDTVLDSYGPADNISDPSGYSANRLGGEVNFTTTGPLHDVTIELDGPEIVWAADQINYGIMGMGHQVILKMGTPTEWIMISTANGFRLNQPYVGVLGMGVLTPDGYQTTGIDSSNGTFRFCECELTTRSLPLDWFSPANSGPHQLVFIEVSGSFSGTNQGSMRMSDHKITHGVTYSSAGEFTTGFTLIDPEADTLAYLEQNCIGGYTPPDDD